MMLFPCPPEEKQEYKNTVASSSQKLVFIDMSPKLALAVADNDPTQIFTLPSDGSMRQ